MDLLSTNEILKKYEGYKIKTDSFNYNISIFGRGYIHISKDCKDYFGLKDKRKRKAFFSKLK